eukprot:GFUD01042625.1.p1 GENE.GFUD01042625.1~~GFUD01042625.1.p1  ORF type:complete len:220 (-),score=92.83 GFUD01042625.1:107-766(-)
MHPLAYMLCLSLLLLTSAKKASDEAKPDWAKKNIGDYTDADLERRLDQWDEDEEPIPADELPDGHPDKPQPQLDLSKLDMSNPEEVMKATKTISILAALLRVTKTGKTVMMFVRITNFKTKEETEEVTSLWQTGLYNNHVQAERFLIEDDRVMFMFRDGKYAWEAKDFLVEQERCEEVQLEQQTYKGKHAVEKDEPKKKEKKDKKKKKKGKATVEKVEL